MTYLSLLKYPILLILSLFLSHSYAQEIKCGSDVWLKSRLTKENRDDILTNLSLIRNDFQEASRAEQISGRLHIPIVVHVMHEPQDSLIGLGSNISADQILSQIDALNLDFNRLNDDSTKVQATFAQLGDGLDIEFCLAKKDTLGQPHSGIIRMPYNQSGSHSMTSSDLGLKRMSRWDQRNYLNIWVVSRIQGGILGYAPSPELISAGAFLEEQDGVVISADVFGSNRVRSDEDAFKLFDKFDLGRTLTHEVGHFLNLRHVWGDGGCIDDDGVDDTPLCSDPNFSCVEDLFECSNLRMTENYMDYTEDACMVMFTNGQKERVKTALSFFSIRNGFSNPSVSNNDCQRLIGNRLLLLSQSNYQGLLGEDWPEVRLKVVDSTGSPMPGIAVWLRTKSSPDNGTLMRATARTHASGEVSFSIPTATRSGTYEFQASALVHIDRNFLIQYLLLNDDEYKTLKIIGNPVPNELLQFEIQFDGEKEVSYMLIDALGKNLIEDDLGLIPWGRHIIPVYGLSTGTYFLKLSIGGEELVRKIVISH